jgi:outer membrane lipoprotein-sorting protein
MKTPVKPSALICLVMTAALIAISIACQPATNTNTNANLTVNANSSPANVNANVSTAPTTGIAAREPERYRATLVLSAETEGGQKTIGIPTLSADVARIGADRRVSFKLPDGSDLIYLEKAGLHIIVAPGRKQYAELTPEATGFQLQKLMTPGQLVSRLENLKGVERVGEETITGRTAEKYRYATTRNTGTKAGEVSAEAFVFVDKETGLPLRAELFTEASGDIQGVKGAKIVAEMRDINTNVDDSLFEVPAGFSKVPPEQIKQQIDALMNTAAALLKALLSNGATQVSSTPSATPTAKSSPSPHE